MSQLGCLMARLHAVGCLSLRDDYAIMHDLEKRRPPRTGDIQADEDRLEWQLWCCAMRTSVVIFFYCRRAVRASCHASCAAPVAYSFRLLLLSASGACMGHVQTSKWASKKEGAREKGERVRPRVFSRLCSHGMVLAA